MARGPQAVIEPDTPDAQPHHEPQQAATPPAAAGLGWTAQLAAGPARSGTAPTAAPAAAAAGAAAHAQQQQQQVGPTADAAAGVLGADGNVQQQQQLQQAAH